MQINLENYQEENFICHSCKWKGKGKELIIEDISDVHAIVDFECPKCGEHIGSGQAKIIDIDKYVNYIKEINDNSKNKSKK